MLIRGSPRPVADPLTACDGIVVNRHQAIHDDPGGAAVTVRNPVSGATSRPTIAWWPVPAGLIVRSRPGGDRSPRGNGPVASLPPLPCHVGGQRG